jgi:threonine dehydrogenase-like Zn-dependent dehydrogenase
VKALTWQGKRQVSYNEVPDPRIQEPTDAVIRADPMLTIFDKQLELRMGQANVHRWSDRILSLLTDEDPLQVDGFATHHLPLSEGPAAYEMLQQKRDGVVKVLLTP